MTNQQVAANAAHVPVNKIHALAASYLSIRAVYNLAYIFIEEGKSFINAKAWADE